MNIRSLFTTSLFFIAMALSVQAQTHKVKFSTNFGEFKVVLYDFTPKHRDMFLNEIKEKTYHEALFNRIIDGFVVQGGEHDVDIAKREALDSTREYPRLAPEFDPRAFHKIGALGAGRDDNPEKASFLNQIYFVIGKIGPIPEAQLDSLESKKAQPFTTQQREEYHTRGGLPRLDQDYMIFGEVYEGMDVLFKISKVATNKQDYPLEKVVFSIEIL